MKNSVFYLVLAVVSISLSSFDKKRPDSNPNVKEINYAIFGENHASTPLLDNELQGHVYYIVSGHGGPDPGANTMVDGKLVAEDEYAYDVSLRLAKNLLMHNAKVYMIVRDENDGIRDEEYLQADKDEVVWGGDKIPVNQSQRLRQRTKIINELYKENSAKGYEVQRVIETHVDSRYTGNKVDIFFYYNDSKPESKALANSMYETVKHKYEAKQRGRGYTGEVKARDLWMIRESVPPIVFIELGNITNEYDRKRLLLADNRQAIANWFAQGILNH
ncbi:N-acetylmuramoyl-L-alanine amidase [Lacihabitans sp. LS3-19]|uniref:N-acetylmuramoyl-L-alanine amidase family protein n=1 Tax=Lacihabitans sp. LS3-19 TaxID=2487335 RepID=UPI0020CE8997|nr:N-acetylmuramoyl-L-alanine amidase [Lacihabitans sp. LS3-19]MCP9770790.1 N-acetylmuramoyl-L-alanine amidase [Lacihabitans sp. LS3-19]